MSSVADRRSGPRESKLPLVSRRGASSLPPEIWLPIFNIFRPSSLPPGGLRSTAYLTLRTVTLTCRLFRDLAQGILFDRLVFRFYRVFSFGGADNKELQTWQRRLVGIREMLESRDECRRWIQNLELHGPDSGIWLRQFVQSEWMRAEEIVRLSYALNTVKLEVCHLSLHSFQHICHLSNLRRFTLHLLEAATYPDEATLANLPPSTAGSLTHVAVSYPDRGNYSNVAPLVTFACHSSVTSLEADWDLLHSMLCKDPENGMGFPHLRSLSIRIQQTHSVSAIAAILASSPHLQTLRVLELQRVDLRIPWDEVPIPSPSLLPLEEVDGSLAVCCRFIPGRPVQKITLSLTPGPVVDLTNLALGTVPVKGIEIRSVAWGATEFRNLSTILPALEELKVTFPQYHADFHWWDAMEEVGDDEEIRWPALRNLEMGADNSRQWVEHPNTYGPPDRRKHVKLLPKLKKRFNSLEYVALDCVPYKFENSKVVQLPL